MILFEPIKLIRLTKGSLCFQCKLLKVGKLGGNAPKVRNTAGKILGVENVMATARYPDIAFVFGHSDVPFGS